ncbi:Flap endonuclease GEN-like 1 [Quillaja saponaria]|uniref:Flap endonuclease GEN-like 1 n=1 Tax=Quillaja saponaria TaxID=32244 RepID=A0AAD7PPM4_QUISA|nr:Flap endonuclease GEN-like 1 [Quillaja saponaria]
MGVGGNFWDLLKPYARTEGFDFLRNKRVAVDLSFWIVQHETAIKNNARNPHLRLTFFRTISLFSKFGAFPVFIVDGTPSPLKSKARIARFFRSSGIDLPSLPVAIEGVSVERNHKFSKCVQECVELLELLGMPILRANGEAEALCAQLDSDGHVDACITADSDAFLFGAKCVIKCFCPNCKEPFECYNISDIEAGLGLKRRHLIAISLLVGNDHDIKGVQGIGLDTALRFVQAFSEDDVLNRLHAIGNGEISLFHRDINPADNCINLEESSPKSKPTHCSFCGHPGSKRAHLKFSCEYCTTSNDGGCMKKPEDFKCDCISCDMNRKQKKQEKLQNWLTKTCDKIKEEPNFPDKELIKMYLCPNHGLFSANDGPCISWGSPKTEMLVDFLAFHQHWDPSYIRQRMLPMLSTIFLRDMATCPIKCLLYGQYEFDSIKRVKIRYEYQFYEVMWKRAMCGDSSVIYAIQSNESDMQQEDVTEVDDLVDLLDESDMPMTQVANGCSFLLTDENMDLVSAAFPEKVDRFSQGMKELKRRKNSSSRPEWKEEIPASPESRSVQLNITNFYRSTKSQLQLEQGDELAKNSGNQGDGTLKVKRKVSSQNLPKSVRRRLLFN